MLIYLLFHIFIYFILLFIICLFKYLCVCVCVLFLLFIPFQKLWRSKATIYGRVRQVSKEGIVEAQGKPIWSNYHKQCNIRETTEVFNSKMDTAANLNINFILSEEAWLVSLLYPHPLALYPLPLPIYPSLLPYTCSPFPLSKNTYLYVRPHTIRVHTFKKSTSTLQHFKSSHLQASWHKVVICWSSSMHPCPHHHQDDRYIDNMK